MIDGVAPLLSGGALSCAVGHKKSRWAEHSGKTG